MSWSAPFSPPIPLPEGGELATLHDARAFLIRLPRHECNSPRWQTAIAAVLMVGNDGGPTDFARIGMLHALRSRESASDVEFVVGRIGRPYRTI